MHINSNLVKLPLILRDIMSHSQLIWNKKIGLLLILFAVFANPLLLGFLFSKDGHIDTPIMVAGIICTEVVFFVMGIFIFCKNKVFFKKSFISKLLLFVVSLLLCFAAVETAIRFLGTTDSDGQFKVGQRYLMPYVLPVITLQENINYFKNLTRPYAVPDDLLGWVIANNSWDSEGLYQSNSMGVRSNKEFDKNKSAELRIELFGDSFMHSYDVGMNESLAHYLEQILSFKKSTEVINFGVGAYGNDQAYLRWRNTGREYSPDIVVIGFQAENCKRNVNIIRKFYFMGTQIPFSKPRFILVNDSLVLVNYPTISYDEVPQVVKNFENDSFSKYEYYYHPTDYISKNIFFNLRTLQYISTILKELDDKKNDALNYEPGSEVHDVCYAILKKFYAEASLNATVYILHLPTQQDILTKMNSQDFVYASMLWQLKNDFKVIDPTNDLLSEARKNGLKSLFVGHYSAKANEIVAASVAAAISNV